jgi:hypothetical protein
MALNQAQVPWHAFGGMLPDIVEGNRFLVALGRPLQNTRFCDRYYAMLERRGLIRLKTSDEIQNATPPPR